MYLRIETGMRGAVCVIRKRYAKANNPDLDADSDRNSPSTYIIYREATNLYWWAKSQFLPSGHLAWLGEAEWRHINWQLTSLSDPFAYVVECELEYRPELHDQQND